MPRHPCFENTSSITDNERASLFHIAGYIAFKENTSSTLLKESDIFLEADSEFTKLVSRGKLKYPSENLFDLSLYLYGYYKSITDKKCINKLLVAFEIIYNCTAYDIENHPSVLRRFANTFNKAFTKKVTDSVKRGKSEYSKRNNVKENTFIWHLMMIFNYFCKSKSRPCNIMLCSYIGSAKMS